MNEGNKGFKNLGNTCYLNSVLQCLSHIDILSNDNFKKYIMKYKKHDSILINEWMNIQNIMWSNEDITFIDPSELVNIFRRKCNDENIWFESFIENDASEFLLRFFDFIHKEISRKITMNIQGDPKSDRDKLYFKNLKSQEKEYENSYSYIIENFYSSSLNLTQCPECNHTIDKHEQMSIISLTLKKGYTSLYDSLNEYTDKIILDDDNKHKCEKCNEYVNSGKKVIFWDLAPFIIFHIKYHDGNLTNHIDYPINLDMDKYTINYNDKSTDYELSGICVHMGGGIDGGHYYSNCKNNNEQKWKMYNDQFVEDIDESNLFNRHPSCLFYKRV